MATLGGARVLGLQDQVGSLEVGKRADLIVLARDALHASPQAHVDPTSAVVYAHKAADVQTVVIDGQVVLRDRQFTMLDETEIRREAERAMDRILSRASFPDDWQGSNIQGDRGV
jgi:5-methylthioadenosine/S-adenosylhomocysteine deaminase